MPRRRLNNERFTAAAAAASGAAVPCGAAPRRAVRRLITRQCDRVRQSAPIRDRRRLEARPACVSDFRNDLFLS